MEHSRLKAAWEEDEALLPIEERRRLFLLAGRNAKKVLKPGDRVRVTKCPGTKRWVTFVGWNGHCIVSKSGISDYSPCTIDRLNGEPVDFKMVEQPQRHNGELA